MVEAPLRRMPLDKPPVRQRLWRTRMGRAVGTIFFATATSRVLGYARELLMAAYFATSRATDAWLMASILPNLLISAIAGALDNVLIPQIIRIREHGSKDEGVMFIRQLITLLTLAGLAGALLFILAMPIVVHLIAPGFRGTQYRETVFLGRLMMPTFLFWLWVAVAVGILRSVDIYGPSAWAPVAQNIVRVGSLLLFSHVIGIESAALGFMIGTGAQILVMLPALRGTGYLFKPALSLAHPALRHFIHQSIPSILSSMAGIGGVVVDRVLASGLPVGNIAALNFSLVLVQIPVNLGIGTLMTPYFTRLSAYQARGQHDAWSRELKVLLVGTAVTMVAITVFIVFASHGIVDIVYRRGHFQHRSTVLTAGLMPYFAVGLPGIAVGLIARKALYSRGLVQLNARWSFVQVAVNIAFDLLLIHPLGARGLALGTSIANTVAAAGVVLALRTKPARPTPETS